MRASDRSRVLRQVLEVRTLQRHASEMALAQAQHAVRMAAEARDAQTERLLELQRRWSATLSAHSLDLGLARAWVAAVADGEVALKARNDEAQSAETSRAVAGDVVAAAIARADATATISRAADRKLSRTLEESLLSETDDRTARRSPRP